MRQLKRAVRDLRGERLEQLPRRALDDLARGGPDQPVVDRVGQLVGSPRLAHVGLDLDVNLELLGVLALLFADAVPAVERHAAELDAVHGANCRFIRGANKLGAVVHARVEVRPARDTDLKAINDIYNHYVTESHYTFDDEPLSLEARREWFTHYAERGRHRVLVALDGGRVVGYASSSGFRPKPAYLTSVETSVYLAPDATGRGAGTRLYERLFRSLEGEDVHRAYAGIALPNPQSIGLHEKFGFKRVAHFTEQGRKFGRYWDVDWFEKPLTS